MTEEKTTKQAPKRQMPLNELDLQMQLTNPEWGSQNINPELQAYLLELVNGTKEEGEEISADEIEYKDLWALLGYYTRDFRLGNLSKFGGEIEYCQQRLDFAGECLQLGAINSFLITLREAITIVELSQSKGGFVRRRGGTITTESIQKGPADPKEKGIFGKLAGKKETGG